jgi:hypothetical protein
VRRLCGLDRGFERGQAAFQIGEAVVRFQRGGFGGAFAARDEAIPAAQVSSAGDEPFAGRERLAFVIFHRAHQGQPRGEFGRAGGHLMQQRVGQGGGASAPVQNRPSPAAGAAPSGAIAAQHGGQRPLPARRDAAAGERGRALGSGGLGPRRLVARQRFGFARHARQFGPRGRQRIGGVVALLGQAFATRGQLLAPGALGGKRGGGLRAARFRFGQGERRIGLRGERGLLGAQALALAVEPGERALRRSERGLRHAPFGFHPGLLGLGLGLGQFGGAGAALGFVQRGGEQRAARFVGLQRGLRGGEVAPAGPAPARPARSTGRPGPGLRRWRAIGGRCRPGAVRRLPTGRRVPPCAGRGRRHPAAGRTGLRAPGRGRRRRCCAPCAVTVAAWAPATRASARAASSRAAWAAAAASRQRAKTSRASATRILSDTVR